MRFLVLHCLFCDSEHCIERKVGNYYCLWPWAITTTFTTKTEKVFSFLMKLFALKKKSVLLVEAIFHLMLSGYYIPTLKIRWYFKNATFARHFVNAFCKINYFWQTASVRYHWIASTDMISKWSLTVFQKRSNQESVGFDLCDDITTKRTNLAVQKGLNRNNTKVETPTMTMNSWQAAHTVNTAIIVW